MRNGDGAALGLAPPESLAVALRADVVADRRADLAATVAMAIESGKGSSAPRER